MRPVWRRVGEQWYAAKEARQDSRFGVSTYVRPSTAPVPVTEARVRYEALNYEAIRLISDRLALGADDVLCDAGCGMGRIICFFASSPLKACVGLEYDPALADAARRNIARLRDRRSPATVVTGDAAGYDYGQVTALVMYNPFGAETLRSVLSSLSSSLIAHPRRIQIAYANPVHQTVFEAFPAFVERERFLAPYLRAPMNVTVWSTVES